MHRMARPVSAPDAPVGSTFVSLTVITCTIVLLLAFEDQYPTFWPLARACD